MTTPSPPPPSDSAPPDRSTVAVRRPSRPSRPSRSDQADRRGWPAEPLDLDIVVPVYNEAAVLEQSIRRLHAHLTEGTEFDFQITIADNASTDETLEIARRLSRELPELSVLHLAQKGRGRALRAAWGRSEASVVAYTDVDLSSDLAALGDLVTPLLEGRGDLAIGSRLAPGASVTRSVKREVISRTYNLLLRAFLEVGFADAQCGFKAGRREVVQALLPLVENDRWFFDTELLYQAQRNMFSIREVPVAWVEDRDSRVAIAATVREDLDGIARLRRSRRDAPAGGGGLDLARVPRSMAVVETPNGQRSAGRRRAPARQQSLVRRHHVPHFGRPSS